jgi:putative FmdB family regulatory protein
MPLYVFACPKCGRTFEELVLRPEQAAEVVCPACGCGKVEKKVASFAARVSGGMSARKAVDCAPGGG